MSNILPLGGILEYLVGIVNVQEGLTLDYREVNFSTPVLMDGGALDTGTPLLRNTRVDLTHSGNGTAAAIGIHLNYNRLSIPQLFVNRSVTFSADPEKNQLREYLNVINDRLGTEMIESDIVDATVDVSDGPVSVNLQASLSSLYVFSAIVLTFEP